MFGKKKTTELMDDSAFAQVTLRDLEGKFREICHDGSTIEFKGDRYVQIVDESALGVPELTSVSEDRGSVKIIDNCIIVTTREESYEDGVKDESEYLYGKDFEHGMLVGNEIITPAKATQKGDKLIITTGDDTYYTEYEFQDGKVKSTAVLKVGFKKDKTVKEGTYVQRGSYLDLSIAKYKERFVEYMGNYYYVAFERMD